MLALVYRYMHLLHIVNFSGLDCLCLCVHYKEHGKYYSECYGYTKTVDGLLKIEKQISSLFHAVKREKFWLIFFKNYRQNGV